MPRRVAGPLQYGTSMVQTDGLPIATISRISTYHPRVRRDTYAAGGHRIVSFGRALVWFEDWYGNDTGLITRLNKFWKGCSPVKALAKPNFSITITLHLP